MNKQDLKVDDYYYAEYSHTTMPGFCIVKGTRNINRPNLYTEDKQFYMKNNCMASQNIRLATPEEKHWLDKCIELNKFITKEEAMKSFIPEYVKCTNVLTLTDSNSWTLNKIYKTVPKESVDFPIKLMIINNNGEKLNVNKWNTDINYYFSFKPSTKEEFEAQNKPVETMKKVTTTIDKLRHDGNIDIPKGTTFEVIEEFENSYQVLKPTGYDIQGRYLFLHKSYFELQEPKFVLPKKYCVRHYKAVVNHIFKLENITCGFSENLNLFSHFPKSNDKYCFRDIQKGYTEITIEQFKKYVLKEESKQESLRKVEVKLDYKVYSLEEISKVINANYEKEDALEIIKTIKSIK